MPNFQSKMEINLKKCNLALNQITLQNSRQDKVTWIILKVHFKLGKRLYLVYE